VLSFVKTKAGTVVVDGDDSELPDEKTVSGSVDVVVVTFVLHTGT
jgi:hypothetical protein